MSLFKKFFGAGHEAGDEQHENELQSGNFSHLPVDEMFTHHFRKNGGKFLYCESLTEVREHFLDILEENDWFESQVMCFEPKLFSMLDENKLIYDKPENPVFLLASCENLIADEGSVLFSSNQIKQKKPQELPVNIVILATTSQIVQSKSDGLREIKKRYEKDYPTNITTIKYFEKAKEEDFLHYGSAAKNLYLLLLEDQ
ncbi:MULTISPECIES: lactate utilization protein B/C [unclassified Flavobacterium]|uniref:lactate utilization protein B/C n=1 Tax=unclassified Flavobacterium TaxID=196869 RepID=UPI001F13625C|nr:MULTISPECIES: lactate utilization protein B/C [unclassified Flavobacterium]UMY64872.1 lactate utilization protein B/C [Flavobacterium sp. HJ-32-4]